MLSIFLIIIIFQLMQYFRLKQRLAVHFFSASWLICRLYIHLFFFVFFHSHLPIFHSFPMADILDPEDHKYHFFFFFFCLFTQPFQIMPSFFVCSHKKCQKSHQVSYRSIIFKNFKIKVFGVCKKESYFPNNIKLFTKKSYKKSY